MSSELLKSACFTVLKKKQDRQFDHQERVKRRTFNPPVNLHIGPGLSSPFPNTYKYLPSIHERTLSPDLKAGRTFSIFHPQHQSLGKTQVFQANLQPQTWTRPSPSKSANSRSYADEICNMISRSVHPDPVGVGARSSAGQPKQTHLRQLEGRGDEASLPTRMVTSNTRNMSLPTQQTKHRYPSTDEPSIAGTSRNISHRDQHSIFPAKDTVAILQSIRQDRRRESIFRDAMISLRKQDLHEKGLADLYERFRLASRKVEFGSAHVPFAVMGIGNINSDRELSQLRYFYATILARIKDKYEGSTPDGYYGEIQRVFDFVMKICAELIPLHYKETLEFYGQLYHESREAKSTQEELKKVIVRKSQFGAYVTSTEAGEESHPKHPFETGTPANPALLKKNFNSSGYSNRSQDLGKSMFQVGTFQSSAVNERFDELSEELRVAHARYHHFKEEAALKERSLITSLEKMKAKCLHMKKHLEIVISAYNKKCALINSLNERIYGEVAKSKLEMMWETDALNKIRGSHDDSGDDDLLETDFEVIQRSNTILESKLPHDGVSGDKAERDRILEMRKVLLRRFVKRRSDSVELGQMKRKKALKLQDLTVEQVRNRLRVKNFQGDTKNLLSVQHKQSQTDLSLADPKFEKILLNPNELELYHQRVVFEDRIQSRVNSSNFMYFLTDEIIRSMFDKQIWDLSNPKPIEVPIDDCELIVGLKEVDIDGELDDKSIKRKSVLRDPKDSENLPPGDASSPLLPEGGTPPKTDKFELERLEDYINFKVHLQLPTSDSLTKYLFISYIYVLYDRKKKQDLIQTRESQIQVLMNICSKLKSRLLETDVRLQRYKHHVETFNELHRDCRVGAALVDFIADPAELENSEKEKKSLQLSAVSGGNSEEKEVAAGGDDFVASTIENLMLRVWKIKAVSKEKNKKYMSFKFVYEKVHRFFQIRLQEVQFQESMKADHPYSLEEHFFRILTEKDVTVKKVEEKIKNFLVTLLNLEPNTKLTIMKKFLKLMPGGLFYGPVEEYYYLRCIEYIKTESRGLEVPINAQSGTNFVSFEKFEGFLNKYVNPKLSPKIASQLNKALRGYLVAVTDPSLGAIAKKGLIDLDDGLEEVLKWVLTKPEQSRPMESYMDLFAILDLSFVGRLSFNEFTTQYDCFNKKGTAERGKLLVQLDNFMSENPSEHDEPSIQTRLDLNTFQSQLRTLKSFSNVEKLFNPIQKFSPEYIHSSEELKQLFHKHAIEGLDGTSDSSLTFLNFCNVMNEFENLFDIDRILKYLCIPKRQQFEGEYFGWKTHFSNNHTKYIDFIQYSIIPDSNWRNQTLKRLSLLKDLFEDHGKVTADYKTLLSSIATENGLNWAIIEPKLEMAFQIKTLLLYRFLLIDLMEVDFEQRVNYVFHVSLPDTPDLLPGAASLIKQRSVKMDQLSPNIQPSSPTKIKVLSRKNSSNPPP